MFHRQNFSWNEPIFFRDGKEVVKVDIHFNGHCTNIFIINYGNISQNAGTLNSSDNIISESKNLYFDISDFYLRI